METAASTRVQRRAEMARERSFPMPMPLLKTNRTKPGRRGHGRGHDETERNQERNRTDPPEKEVVDGRRPQAFPPSIESKSQAESSKKRDKVDDLDECACARAGRRS